MTYRISRHISIHSHQFGSTATNYMTSIRTLKLYPTEIMTSLYCFHSRHSSLSYSQMIINRISVLIKLCSFMTMLVKLPLRFCCHPAWDRITQIIIECSYCYCILDVFRVFNSYSLTLACLLIHIIVIEPGIWFISCLVINSKKKTCMIILIWQTPADITVTS